MYRIEVMPEFILDRERILDFIYSETFSESILKTFYANIESRILALKIFPEMYPKKMGDFRVITFKTYLVFYKFNKKNE